MAQHNAKQSKGFGVPRSACPINYAVEVFGDGWTLLVLRDLILHGKRRYSEFLASAEKIASNILAERLKRLEAHGIIERTPDPEDGRRVLYSVTEKGLSLTPVLLEIAAWGATHDRKTGAPDGFVDGFYADREAYYADHQNLIAALFEGQNEKSGQR